MKRRTLLLGLSGTLLGLAQTSLEARTGKPRLSTKKRISRNPEQPALVLNTKDVEELLVDVIKKHVKETNDIEYLAQLVLHEYRELNVYWQQYLNYRKTNKLEPIKIEKSDKFVKAYIVENEVWGTIQFQEFYNYYFSIQMTEKDETIGFFARYERGFKKPPSKRWHTKLA